MSDAPDRTLWHAAEAAVIAFDDATLTRLLETHPELRAHHPPAYTPSGPVPGYAKGDARMLIAREQFFATWDEVERFLAARAEAESQVARFERAVDAIASGDEATLTRLLTDDPSLIGARSMRRHQATLLHYVGANGIEGFRQRTPANAVRIATMLLDAGADPNATARIYGDDDTTLGLVATSIHPLNAGVQPALIELLLARGASLDEGARLVNGCLANGRGEAAEQIAGLGVPLDLEAAAGVGRLDLVHAHFDASGQLQTPATHEQRRRGFAWACEFGRTGVAEFLLDHGVRVDDRLPNDGQIGLHWAALDAHVETVAMLLARGSSVTVTDESYGGTPLRWALYGFATSGHRVDAARFYDTVAQLVAAGSEVPDAWFDASREGDEVAPALAADARMRSILGR